MTLTQVTDHVDEALDNLVQEFKGQANLAGMITAYVNQIQDIETALFEVLEETNLDNAIGAQLDGIGAIVGEDRQGRPDDVYRVAIRARIILNLGNGTPEDIIALMRSVSGGADIILREYWPAAITAELSTLSGGIGAYLIDRGTDFQLLDRVADDEVISRTGTVDPAVVSDFLQEGKPAGVKAHLLFRAEEPFQFDSGLGFDEGHYGGGIE